jgi:DnaK suppressor protein
MSLEEVPDGHPKPMSCDASTCSSAPGLLIAQPVRSSANHTAWSPAGADRLIRQRLFLEGTTMHSKIDSIQSTSATVLHDRLPAIRAELDQQRRFRAEQLDELAVDAAEALATADTSRLQVTQLLTVAAESAMDEIDIALRRLEEGSYGTCQRCGDLIPWERLEILPMTGLCTPCQWFAEWCRSIGLPDTPTSGGRFCRREPHIDHGRTRLDPHSPLARPPCSESRTAERR